MAIAIQAREATERRCEVTGLVVDRSAERQIMAHAVTAVVYLAIGGIMALTIALTRWQLIHLLPMTTFYEFVSAHGLVMLIFWIVFFEMAGLIFASTVLLSARMLVPWLGWLSYGMMLVGSVIAFGLMLSGQATVMFTSYPPLQAPPLYYAGVLLFAVGAIFGVVHFFINLVGARLRGEVATLPLFTFALMAAAILALWSLLAGAAALIPVFLWSLGFVSTVDPGAYRLLYWGLGHGTQQVNLAAMVGTWYGLASLTTGAKPLNEGLSRFAIVLYILFVQVASMHHLQVDPGFNSWVRNANVSYIMYAAVIGSLIHAFSIPGSVEQALRSQGHRRGLFTWLRRAPWGEPGFSALVVSLLMFGVMGGISGVIIGGPQLNMISHNTLIAPAHFHMTVVSGTTAAFMGLSYYLVPLIFQRELVLRSWARYQPYLYGLGMLIWGLGMGLAGHWGVPRRHWDISFASAPPALRYDFLQTPEINIFLAILGIGAIVAVTAGAMFVVSIVLTVFAGTRSATPALGKVAPDTFSSLPAIAGAAVDEAHEDEHGFEVPGTLVLAVGFLALFIVLYGVSWHELSTVPWRLFMIDGG
ncbi:MAG: cbb3-type cytochrome c oxidase subunit I [Chloroflexi bacterium]|nr:cbb3-type cytochrome c oxidase subunit I [Chloroflexota bacterium]